jgi:hypothetical protein
MDNGPENNNHEVRGLLERNRVIALWNEPHTPQHNPRAERVIGDLKRAGGFPSRWRPDADATQGPVCAREPRGTGYGHQPVRTPLRRLGAPER